MHSAEVQQATVQKMRLVCEKKEKRYCRVAIDRDEWHRPSASWIKVKVKVHKSQKENLGHILDSARTSDWDTISRKFVLRVVVTVCDDCSTFKPNSTEVTIRNGEMRFHLTAVKKRRGLELFNSSRVYIHLYTKYSFSVKAEVLICWKRKLWFSFWPTARTVAKLRASD